MELANILLALGGDRGNTVPKYAVTAAEIALLLAIHGDDAVFDILPIEKASSLTNRQELIRLKGLYAKVKGEDDQPIVERLFPGAAARVFETLEELNLPEDLYRTVTRVKPSAKKASEPKTAEPKAAKPAKKKAAEAEPETDQEESETEEVSPADDNGGVADMDADVFS